MIGVQITDNRTGRKWVEARSAKRQTRRAVERQAGKVTGRQWRKMRRHLMKLASEAPQNA